MEPRPNAITGVPHAIDSVIAEAERLFEADKVEERGGAAQEHVALGRPDRTDEPDASPVDPRLDEPLEVRRGPGRCRRS